MQLWTDYEGVIIDGAYPLQKLLMPEGRSAFYSTTGPDGKPTVVRLIECHFDEEEILARWRSMEALNHPNFLKFEHFGQTEIDGRPVVYAVLEQVDANLAEVLDHGTLPVKDVAQIAASLVAALDVLHTHGFIHEHIEPRNIFALNEVVKLRSDCIREAPEGEEGRAAKERDVQNLATVLLQALTQRHSIEGIPASAIPVPFNNIIRKGLDGTWGLEDIKAALEGQFAPKQAAVPNWANPAATAATVSAPATTPRPAPAPAPQAQPAAVKPVPQAEAQLPLPLREDDRSSAFAENEDVSSSRRSRWISIAGLVAFLLLVFTWVLARHPNAPQDKLTQTPAISQPVVVPQPSPPAPTADVSPVSVATPAPSHAGWRVIAFTYNRRKDAENKVSALARSHPQLAPAVFSPSGRAPYFVSIGGVMDEHAAITLAHRSRSFGLPRDTFARNYTR